GTGSLISAHPPESVSTVASIVGHARLFARCNAPGEYLRDEIERLLDQGVRCLMVPMIRRYSEAEAIVSQVRNRAKIVLMIEHKDILDDADRVIALPHVDTIYVGTNDLALSMGYRTRFGPIAAGWVESLARLTHSHGKSFSFLGFARLGANIAVPPDLLLAEYVRYKVNWGLFARSFGAEASTFALELGRVRARLAWWKDQPEASLLQAHSEFVDACKEAERVGLSKTLANPIEAPPQLEANCLPPDVSEQYKKNP
ncbi:MAG: aldolase/citrate lyase family protein, partial [Casimicrobium sp.]